LAGASPYAQATPTAPVTLAAADFNRDGRDDFITLNTSRQPLLYLSTSATTYAAPQAFATGFNLNSFTTGDFNGDGAADAIGFSLPLSSACSGEGGTTALLLLGNGQGGFAPATRVAFNLTPTQIFAEDVNGDGRTDLVLLNSCVFTSTPQLSVVYGTAAGGFTPSAAFPTTSEPIATLTIGDLNNDSRKDLVLALGQANGPNPGGSLLALLARSDDTFAAPLTLGPLAFTNALAVADFTGDGLNDVFAYQQSFSLTPSFAVFANQCFTIRTLALASAASYSDARFAPDSIIAAFGSSLATATTSARLPLPTELAGTRVIVTDNTGLERAARLYFVSPAQVNFQMPPEIVAGTARVSIVSGNGVLSSGLYRIAPVAPGLFTANATGQGVAAAVVLRLRNDGVLSYEPVARFDSAANRIVPVPIDLGAESDQLALLLYGTGLRNRRALSGVTARIGGLDTQVLYAGAQGDFASLDQINVLLPRTLRGRGEVDIVLTVDGLVANTVRVAFR
jgi:uncharacterized protein (TIGR03437 family)